MKIKVKAQDFMVKEEASLSLKAGGRFAVYLLRKRDWGTVEVLHSLSKELRLPISSFAYGGRKDRHALTCQYITIENKKTFIPVHKDYSLEFLGFMDRPMGPDLIAANEFKITLRDLDSAEIKYIKTEINKIKTTGYCNYFDDQRFGSYQTLSGFLAEKILKKHYNGALKIYLTYIGPRDKAEEKKRKTKLSQKWGNWQVCLSHAKTNFEGRAFKYLVRKPKGFLRILRKIPARELSFFFSAYQSYLWNELLRRLVKTVEDKNTYSLRGQAGDYIFYDRLKEGESAYFKNLQLPLPCAKAKMPDEQTQKIYEGVLRDNQIKRSMFNDIKTRQSFFGYSQRKAVVVAEDISLEQAPDDIYKNRLKCTLSFRLGRGSYGTMLVKRLLSKKGR